MRTRIAWIVAVGMLSGPSFAADQAFYDAAARGGLAEVALGRLAAEKASSEDMKAFGRRMVEEHGAANQKLAAAAAKSGVQLPTALAPEDRATQAKLQGLSGSAFDRAYAESQVKAHAETIGLLEKQIASGSDAAAKAWASESLPVVKRHAEMIGTLDNEAPGKHEVEHATRTPGPAAAPPREPAAH